MPHSYWADYAFPRARYGQHTSNLVEQQNWVYLQAREMPVLDMFAHIWNDMQGKIYRRFLAAQSSPTSLSIIATTLYRQSDDSARSYDAIPSSRFSGLVYLRQDSQKEFKVDLHVIGGKWSGSCSCGRFQNDRLPCPHGLALIHELKDVPPLHFIDQFWTKEAWCATYSQPLPAVLRSELVIDESMEPPAKKKQRGRPQKKRREQGESGPASQALPIEGDVEVDEFQGIESVHESAEEDGREAEDTQRTRPSKSHWVYVVDIPQVEKEITSRTRSGRQ